MKLLPYLITICIFAMVSFSCQKSLSDPSINTIDSSGIFKPKQMIVTEGTGLSAVKQYYSIKYATDGRQIDLYLDDTTNTNPFDALSSSFLFNAEGYIVKYIGQVHGSREEAEDITINRSADNKIVSLISLYERHGKPFVIDTCFLNYSTSGTGFKITDFVKSYNFDDLSQIPKISFDTLVYTYDASNKFLQLKINNTATYDCEYNANGSLKKIHYGDIWSGVSDATFSYASGTADSKEDLMQKLFAGKDYYLQDISDYPALGDRYDEPSCCVFSLTNPFHISGMHVVANKYGQSSTNDFNYAYQFNGNQLPVSILSSRFHTLTEFRY